MCVYSVLDSSFQWQSLCKFIQGEESYVAEITGEKHGYQFRYISSTTNYVSSIYPTRDAAIKALKLALLRSLVMNSSLSILVANKEGNILCQSEKNICHFGMKGGRNFSEIKKIKTSWEAQEVFEGDLVIYKEVG